MLLWSSVYSALRDSSFSCPQCIIFLISDFSLPKFLPAVSPNLRLFEWFSWPWFPASFFSFSFENILLVKGWYLVLGSFPLANCAYLPAYPRLVVSDLNRKNDSCLFGLGKNRISLLDLSSSGNRAYVIMLSASVRDISSPTFWISKPISVKLLVSIKSYTGWMYLKKKNSQGSWQGIWGAKEHLTDA